MRVTAGAYPNASPAEVATLFPDSDRFGDWLFAMDWPGVPSFKMLRPLVFVVGRRYHLDPQVNFETSPESEADRWFGVLAASGMNASLDGWIGPNEYFSTWDLDDVVWDGVRRGQWVARFETRLGRRVYYELRKHYWWGSIAVGNVEPWQYASYFRDALGPEAAPWLEGPAYHAYCPPHWTTAERPGQDEYPHFVYRPSRWWNEAGGRWRMCLINEAGTFYPWKQENQSPAQYAATMADISDALATMRGAGIPVGPPAAFGYGLEGDTGITWNVDGSAFTNAVATRNATQALTPVAAPMWYPPGVLAAEYYANTGLSGLPAYAAPQPAPLAISWGASGPAPGVPAQDISMRWTGRFALSRGIVEFAITVGDGVRLWVGGRLLVDQWHDVATGTYRVTWPADGSESEIRLECYRRGGIPQVRFAWTVVGPLYTTNFPWFAQGQH